MDRYGYIPSPPDSRDYISTAAIPQDLSLPSKFSLRNKVKYILDQGSTSMCVGFASANLKNIQEVDDNNLPDKGFSPLYVYTLCKQLDGIPNMKGTYPRIAMQVLSQGILPENDLPFNNDDTHLPTITDAQKQKASPYKIKSYAQIPVSNLDALKQALVTQGAVSAALSVTYPFYYPEQNKYINKPMGQFYGGHNIDITGFDDDMTFTFSNGITEKGFIEIFNSWGNWADGGFAYVPYSSINWQTDNGYPFWFEWWTSIDDHGDAPQPDKPKYWRVQVGAFSQKSNANNEAQKLKSLGYNTYIVFINNLYKCQLGAFSVETNARKLSAELKNKGIDNFIVYY